MKVMAALASQGLAHSAPTAPWHSLRARPCCCLCLQPQSGHAHPPAAAFAHCPRPTARPSVRAAAAGQSEPGPGEAPSPSGGDPPRPGKRVLTNEERRTLGLPPLKGTAPSQAETQAPPRPVPSRSGAAPSKPPWG